MATIIERERNGDSSGVNGVILAIILLLLVFLMLFYGLPALRGITSGPSITVPKEIDINVNPNNGGGSTQQNPGGATQQRVPVDESIPLQSF